MCGLVSVVSKNLNGFWKPQVDMFHELLFVDNFRGDDSTGMFLVDKDGDLEMLKEATDSPTFQKSKDYGDLMRKAFHGGRAVVGHNRKATKGTINDANAHPFIVDDRIILVHNGTLFGDYQKLAGEGNKVEVDSHAIAHLIHQANDNVEEALKEINGAYALIWFDMEQQTLNFVRNSQRPLHYMETADAFVWASEKNMLDWMVSRHQIVNPKIAELPAGTQSIFTLNKNSLGISSKVLDLSRKVMVTVPDYDACGYIPGWHGQDGWDDESSILAAPQTDERRALSRALQRMENENKDKTTTVFEEISASIVQGAQKPRLHMVDARNANLAVRREEEGLAFDKAAQITVTAWANSNASFVDGSRYRGKCFQYSYINGKDSTHGYYLYAVLANSPQLLVRGTLAPTEPELLLVDLTTNRKDASFLINGRAWRSFENKDFASERGDGFGIFYAKDPKRILFGAPSESTEPKKEEEKNA